MASTLRAWPRLLPPSCSSHLCAPRSWRTAGFNKDVGAEDSEIPWQDLQACLCRMLPPSHPVCAPQRPAPCTNSTVTALAGYLLALPLLSLGLPSLQMSQAIVLSTHRPTPSLPSVLLPPPSSALPQSHCAWYSCSPGAVAITLQCPELSSGHLLGAPLPGLPSQIASLSFPSAPCLDLHQW